MTTMQVEIVSAEGERGLREALLRARERSAEEGWAGITRQGWLQAGTL
jgi:hypothetical protein